MLSRLNKKRQSVALTLWFCNLYKRSTIILVEMFSDMFCLEHKATLKCQTNSRLIRLIEIAVVYIEVEEKQAYSGTLSRLKSLSIIKNLKRFQLSCSYYFF